MLEVGIVPQVPTASALPYTWTLKWVYKELGGTTALIRVARFIVWDEAPMAHKHVFEAVNRTL